MKRVARVELDHETIPWLLAVAAGTVAPHMAHLPWWLTGLVVVILLWRTGLWQQRRPLPHRGWRVLLVVGCVAAITWQFRTLFGRPGLILSSYVCWVMYSVKNQINWDVMAWY